MPSRALEIVLITLILFFVYYFLTNLFSNFPLYLYSDTLLGNYIRNNVVFCIALGNLYLGRMYCYVVSEPRIVGIGYIDVKGDIVYVTFGSKVNFLNLSEGPFSKYTYLTSTGSFFLYSYPSNLTFYP
ncbi:MAG: hypothetical protein BXU00_01715 [Candidatus Nanoclepta minutus]|uniref:Uncharacterized protein n=1 Tax=Candidatus Nanoclepta minutus TaxID=1940235 RepID=A0A397WNG9_9ARCH|nr:MAG: hypothetical protein BXU00_01715 [Candidatus Nanoclepta minutus]